MDSPQLVWIDTWAEGEGGKRELWPGQFYSRGAYTIFPHIEAENAIFLFRSRAGMRHFRPGVRKIIFLNVYFNIKFHFFCISYFPLVPVVLKCIIYKKINFILKISVYIWDVMPKKLFIIHEIIYFSKKLLYFQIRNLK